MMTQVAAHILILFLPLTCWSESTVGGWATHIVFNLLWVSRYHGTVRSFFENTSSFGITTQNHMLICEVIIFPVPLLTQEVQFENVSAYLQHGFISRHQVFLLRFSSVTAKSACWHFTVWRKSSRYHFNKFVYIVLYIHEFNLVKLDAQIKNYINKEMICQLIN